MATIKLKYQLKLHCQLQNGKVMHLVSTDEGTHISLLTSIKTYRFPSTQLMPSANLPHLHAHARQVHVYF